jgi:hypothetical protein
MAKDGMSFIGEKSQIAAAAAFGAGAFAMAGIYALILGEETESRR